MPTYEYVCEKCGKHFDLFQRMSAEPIHTCPDENCQGPVKRLIGEGAGIIFKGHGFYCTDYKNPTPPSGGQHHHHHGAHGHGRLCQGQGLFAGEPEACGRKALPCPVLIGEAASSIRARKDTIVRKQGVSVHPFFVTRLSFLSLHSYQTSYITPSNI